MNLKAAIERNRIRHARFKRAEYVLRRVRQRIFDYEDAGQLAKAERLIATCKRVLAPKWRAERAAAEDRKLQRTPSAFEPGGGGR